MKKLFLVSSLFSLAAFAGEWKGVISDASCAAKHADASEKSMACAAKCIKGGAAPVFVSDGKVYKVAEASASKVIEHAGHKVMVMGSLDGDTITVDSVKMDH